MTILYLRPDNFFVNQYGELCNTVKGMSFVMFTSKQCVFCHEIQPTFKKLSKCIRGCTFVEMDVDQQYQKIRSIASSSSTPINFVPYLLFYINGRPMSRYVPEEQNPSANFDKMRQFLLMQSQHQSPSTPVTHTSASTTGSHTTTQPPKQNIPEYSIGKPVCSGQNVCYLGYNKAYK